MGYQAGINATDPFDIYIGNSGVARELRTIRIGELGKQTTCFIQGIRGVTTGVRDAIPVFIGVNGRLGTVSSSKRFKSNIHEMTDESYKIFELTPVSFIYNEDETRTMQYGLIAEEVDTVFPALVVREADGAAYTVRYEMLPVLLLNEMKKRKQNLQRYENDITMLKHIVTQLHAQVQRFVAG